MAYTPTEWKDGDIITAEKMNNLEQAVVEASNKEGFELSDRIAKGVDADGNVIDGAVVEGFFYPEHPQYSNQASGQYSHAEGGMTTIASGTSAHAEGGGTIASGSCSHAEGAQTQAVGNWSHAEGNGTYAGYSSQHVFGEYNLHDPEEQGGVDGRGEYVEIVGNGTSDKNPSNARTLDWVGNEWIKGSYSANGSLTLGKGTADEVTITAAQLKQLLATLS